MSRIGLNAIDSVLSGFDLKNGSLELRRDVDAAGPRYTLTVNGDGVMTSYRLAKLWYVLSAGIAPESIAVVSSSGSMRALRYQVPTWIPTEPEAASDDRDDMDDERYARNRETVCDLLPDFRVTLGDVFNSPADPDPTDVWEEYYAAMTDPDTRDDDAVYVPHPDREDAGENAMLPAIWDADARETDREWFEETGRRVPNWERYSSEQRHGPIPAFSSDDAGWTVHGIAAVSPDGKQARFTRAVPGLAI